MSLDNKSISNKLYDYADRLEAMGENPYKIRAYRKAAYAIDNMQENINYLIEQNFDLTLLPSIGKGISFTIESLVKTGAIPESTSSPKKVDELVDIKGLGPKRRKLLHEKYEIYTKADLLKAIQTKQIDIFSPELTAKIAQQIKQPEKSRTFLRLSHALSIIEFFVSQVKQIPGVERVDCCGDYRRRQEVIQQLVLIIQGSEPAKISAHFTTMREIKHLLYQQENFLKVQLKAGIEMDIYWVTPKSLGAALLFYTGSDEHFKALSDYASQKGYELSKEGLFKEKNCIAAQQEEEIYTQLGLAYITPELRENRGEIKAAKSGKLPQLITLTDIKGDLHSHTNETDGKEPLESMVNTAAEHGYEYIAITDHSKSLTITNGMDEKRLLQQIKQIEKLNSRLSNILILKSMEVDILEDGSLDLADEVLKELDIVVCSVHSKFKLPEAKQTERIIRAMDNPYFNILGHATGRLIKSRPPYSINLDRILQAAKERNCFIELNAQPYRLDIKDVYCKRAKEMGVKIAISSDAHTSRGFNFMQLGIYQARRGWLEKDDVINTRSWPELQRLLKKP
jgi:DNA polymerase (family 10)